MKRFTYLAAMLLIMAGAVSCEKKAGVNDPVPQPTGEMRYVTVSAGQGAERTSVSGGTLTWSSDDQLSIVPTTVGFEAVALGIKEGAGSAIGTFEGMIDKGIKDDTQLYGWAGGDWTYSNGAFTINMSDAQTYVDNGLAENAYPSIGTGTIEDGFTLSNPFGVLCLIVKGEGAVKSIEVASAANNLAGEFTVEPSATPISVTGGSSKTLTLNCTSVALATTGVKFYMVVPAANYAAGDLTVTVTMSDNSTFNATLGETAVTAGSATKVEVLSPKSTLDSMTKKDGEWNI